jgi:Sulfotransferase family
MNKQLILHIGTLKTGSTSLQQFLLDHANYLSRKGFALYRGEIQEVNHTELHLAAMRYERDSFAKLGICKHLTIDASYTQHVTEQVQSFINSCREPRIIFTSEALSWLRHDDEIDRLRTILDLARHEARVVLYLRNKEDFLRSYTSQLYKVKGRKPSSDCRSVLYVEPDTWLTDYNSLLATYQRGFGSSNVVVIDYDEEMRRVENVIPSFLRALGLDSTDTPSFTGYFRNTTNPDDQRKPSRGAKRWIKWAKQAWHQWNDRRAA